MSKSEIAGVTILSVAIVAIFGYLIYAIINIGPIIPVQTSQSSTGSDLDVGQLYCQLNGLTSVKDLPAYCLKYYR